MLMSLEQVEGDMGFLVELLSHFCISAKEQLASCRRAAHVCDIATLSFEAHSMKGGAASCCATQLATSCGVLERMARLEQEYALATTDPSTTVTSAKLPEYWSTMVDDVAGCLNTLSHYVNALASMRTLPSFDALKEACGESTDDIVGALSTLLEAGVHAYVATHAAILKDVQCDVGEKPYSVAREKLGLARAAASTVSVEDLVRTAGSLSDHLANPPPLGGTSRGSVYRTESELRLKEMRIVIERLAAELCIIVGEKMPVLAVPFVDNALESVCTAPEIETVGVLSTGIIVSAESTWGDEPICDYTALLQYTKDDHKFIAALLINFKDSLSMFCDGLADQKCSLFDAYSLHGAAVSMCAPRVVAAIHDLIVATKDGQRKKSTADSADPSVQRIDADAMESTIQDLRAADLELAGFLQALESGEPHLHAMIRRVVQ